MKFTRLVQPLLLGSALAFGSAAFAKDEIFKIDTAQSTIKWEGSKAVGGGHIGTIGIKEGKVIFKGNNPVKAEVVVNMNSIVNEDLKDASFNKKLVDHLKSDDFFDVAKHPHATLVIDSFKKGSKGDYALKGTLTIKGISKPVSFTAKESVKGQVKTIHADLVFDRSLFDVRYGSGKFFDNLGDKLINDHISLKTSIVLESKATKTAKK